MIVQLALHGSAFCGYATIEVDTGMQACSHTAAMQQQK
jgi:hypothetical protein